MTTGPIQTAVVERRILQEFVRENAIPAGHGWVVYAVPCDDDGACWPFDAYKPLVARRLLDKREDWKHIYVRVTDAGWAALAAGDRTLDDVRAEKAAAIARDDFSEAARLLDEEREMQREARS